MRILKYSLLFFFLFFTKTIFAQVIEKSNDGTYIVVMPDGTYSEYDAKNKDHQNLMKVYKKQAGNANEKNNKKKDVDKKATEQVKAAYKSLEKEKDFGKNADEKIVVRNKAELDWRNFIDQNPEKKKSRESERLENWYKETKANEKTAIAEFKVAQKESDNGRKFLFKNGVDVTSFSHYKLFEPEKIEVVAIEKTKNKPEDKAKETKGKKDEKEKQKEIEKSKKIAEKEKNKKAKPEKTKIETEENEILFGEEKKEDNTKKENSEVEKAKLEAEKIAKKEQQKAEKLAEKEKSKKENTKVVVNQDSIKITKENKKKEEAEEKARILAEKKAKKEVEKHQKEEELVDKKLAEKEKKTKPDIEAPKVEKEKKAKKNDEITVGISNKPFKLSPAEDKILNPPFAPCEIAFEGIDEFTKVKRKETSFSTLFKFTDEVMFKYYEKNDFLTCEVSASCTEKGYKYLTFLFRFKSDNVQNTYGVLEKDQVITLRLLNGDNVPLFNSKTDRGFVDVVNKTTTYKAIVPILNNQEKILFDGEVDQIRVLWGTGTDDYPIYDLDFFENILQCVK